MNPPFAFLLSVLPGILISELRLLHISPQDWSCIRCFCVLSLGCFGPLRGRLPHLPSLQGSASLRLASGLCACASCCPFSQWPGLSSALVSCSLRAAVILFSLGAACFSCMACASHGLPPSVPALPVSVLALAVLRGWGSVGDFSVWHTQRAGASGWPVLLCRRRTTLLCELRSAVLWRCS